MEYWTGDYFSLLMGPRVATILIKKSNIILIDKYNMVFDSLRQDDSLSCAMFEVKLMRFRSIKQTILYILIPLAVIPVLLVGTAGILNFMEVTRQNIGDDNLAQAKAIALYTSEYVNTSIAYLDSLASRPYVITSLVDRNFTIANITAEYAVKHSDLDIVYITDSSGMIVSSYPDPATRVGINHSYRPYVHGVTGTVKPYVGGPFINRSEVPAVYMSVPIVDDNDTLQGVMVGQVNPDSMAQRFFKIQVKNAQYIYLVNGSGIIIVHPDRSNMQNMTDYSMVPAVEDVLKGVSGVKEQYNPVENETMLSAYAPVPGTGWGVVVALPTDVAYRPYYDSAVAFGALVILVAAIAGAVAWLLGSAIANPILSISTATKKMINGGDYYRYLPMRRRDEIGELARSFEDMSRRIATDKERIVDEKNRAELYVDIMGHDINNLNQSAMSNLELIQDEPNLTEEEKKSIEEALSAVRGSANIIDNVRKIQRINEEKLDIIPEDLNDLLEACIKDIPRPQGKKVIINYTPKPGLVVKGNPLLREAFCNVIGNSIKYSGSEVTINITVNKVQRASGPFYEVAIEDNGYGIPPDVKPRLFRRFERGRTKAHGKGLGLYIVRSLVERLGGSVRVEDRVPGDYTKGSRFIISLPASEERKDGH
jgi:signal transduction histidine kinase